MFSDKLIIHVNYKEIEQAKELGIPEPETKIRTAEILFYKDDVKRAILDEEKIMVYFSDGDAYSFEYNEKMWKELKQFFKENEE